MEMGEACCYQFCVAVCISRRGACHNSVKFTTVPLTPCQYAAGRILTTSRWTHWEEYFPSLTLCLSFVPLSVIAGNLLRAADSCFTPVLVFSLKDCVCLCHSTCTFMFMFEQPVWGSPTELGNSAGYRECVVSYTMGPVRYIFKIN